MATVRPSPGTRQLRLSLSNSACAALLDLQRQAVEQGLHKPSYSELIDAAIANLGDMDVASVIRTLDVPS